MAFFTDDALSSFSDILKKNEYLNEQTNQTFLQKNNLALLNKNDVINWLINTRSIGSTSHPREAKRQRTITAPIDFEQVQIDTFVERLAQDQCKNQVGEGYGIDSVDSSISTENYDILLVVTDTHQTPNTTYVSTADDYIKFKMEQVKGFMIVEKGECKKYLNRYSVRLICSKANQGTLLMGMYLYTLLTTQNGDDQTGILELAGGYKNTPGLCTYAKFGFSQDDDLNGTDCFSAFKVNLPMSVKLNGTSVTEDDIIKVILRKKNKLNIVNPNDTELCTTYKPDDFLQEHLQTKLAKLIEEKRINNFLPNELKSKVNYDSDINFTKDWIISEKNKKGTVTNTEFTNEVGSDNTGCMGPDCAISGGKQTNRKRKGCKRTNRKRKGYKRTTRKSKGCKRTTRKRKGCKRTTRKK